MNQQNSTNIHLFQLHLVLKVCLNHLIKIHNGMDVVMYIVPFQIYFIEYNDNGNENDHRCELSVF